MKYSLRNLMIVVTLVCVTLGGAMGRIEYLRWRAAYHRHEEQILKQRLLELSDLKPGSLVPKDGARIAFDHACSLLDHHEKMRRRYSRAVYRPWTVVSESDQDTNP
jgi:hypothetical protein